MSGRTIRILQMTQYDFGHLDVGATSPLIPVAIDVDVAGAREITLLIRVHALTLPASGTPLFTITVLASAPTNEDPDTFFREPTSTPLATALLSTALGPPIPPAPPVLVRCPLPANAGAWMTVLLSATQGASSPDTLTATLSIDVSMKD